MLAHEFYHGLRESLRAELRERHPPAGPGGGDGGPARRARTLEAEMAAEYYPKPAAKPPPAKK